MLAKPSSKHTPALNADPSADLRRRYVVNGPTFTEVGLFHFLRIRVLANTPMTAHGFVELLTELGIDRSYSRPRVSDDNPFSESCFHTIKYQPDYPGLFRNAAHARAWFGEFFGWYHEQHHHEGLSLFTPAEVYFGRVERVAERRQKALDDAYRRHPERFVAGPPIVARPPQRVLLNPLDAAPSTVATVLDTPDDQFANIWPSAAISSIPQINLPGAQATRDQLANAT